MAELTPLEALERVTNVLRNSRDAHVLDTVIGTIRSALTSPPDQSARIAELEKEVEIWKGAAIGNQINVSMFDRNRLGREVREAWITWAKTQPNPKASWLVPYDNLSEPDKEADRQIGEHIAGYSSYLISINSAEIADLRARLEKAVEVMKPLEKAVSENPSIKDDQPLAATVWTHDGYPWVIDEMTGLEWSNIRAIAQFVKEQEG